MTKTEAVRILFIETDAATRRSVELYLQGFSPREISVKTLSSSSEALSLLGENWDAVLVHGDRNNPQKTELFEQAKRRLGGIPIVDLGESANELITSGAGTQLEEVLPRVNVGLAPILRSVSHLIERRNLERIVENLQSNLSEASHTDPLTGLWNHQYMAERMAEEFMSWQRYRYPLSICLFEIKGLDHINDTYGFEVADEVMRQSGKLIRETKRNTDFAGRSSTEAFSMIFPKTPTASALVGIERIRDAIRRTLFHGKASENFTVEACFGVAQLSEGHQQISELRAAARGALRRAQSHGGSQIEVAYPGTVKAPKGPRVLVVDDHTASLDLCCDVFQEKGYLATAARSGREAFRAMEEQTFDLYVLDLRLPDIDGRDLVKRISAQCAQKPRIVVVTGESDTNLSELRSLGVSNMLRKPFSGEAIYNACESLLGASGHAPLALSA